MNDPNKNPFDDANAMRPCVLRSWVNEWSRVIWLSGDAAPALADRVADPRRLIASSSGCVGVVDDLHCRWSVRRRALPSLSCGSSEGGIAAHPHRSRAWRRRREAEYGGTFEIVVDRSAVQQCFRSQPRPHASVMRARQ